jgi:amidase
MDMDDICFLSIQEIHRLLKKKQLTVKSLVSEYLKRIAEVDKGAEGLNSVLELNPDALFIAESFDNHPENGEDMPPLFGIPILIKDNINSNDRLRTSAGSVALAGNYAPYDAHIVKLLRRAGALILGKANMTEFANFMSDADMPSGYSSRGGQVINPYNRDKTPSGSSSGSAVAVAAGLCTVSVGTETSGSIISPAGQNGIVGIKPTLGLVSRSGIIPICGTHDTAGPMARTVRDAAVLLGVIAGCDRDDCATHIIGNSTPSDYTKYLDPDGLKGARIGINRSQKLEEFALSEEAKAKFDNICKIAADAGAVIIDNINIDSNFAIGNIMRHEFKASINYYLSTINGGTRIKTLKDIILYNQEHASIALKYGQGVLLDAENNKSGNLTEPEYIEALLERERTIAELDRLFDENGLDVMLCETMTNIAPFTGFPSMTIPTGQRFDKLPTDSYWIARRFDEAALFRVTYALEKRLNLCLRPEITGSAPAPIPAAGS